jgi:hypothetical protein
VKLVKASSLMSWTRLKHAQELSGAEYVEWFPSALSGVGYIPRRPPSEFQPGAFVMDPADKEAYIDILEKNLEAMNDAISATRVFVSHRWVTPEHPDPDSVQLQEIKERITTLAETDPSFLDALIFYDYCSIIQNPVTDQQYEAFNRDVRSLQYLAGVSTAMIILSASSLFRVGRITRR